MRSTLSTLLVLWVAALLLGRVQAQNLSTLSPTQLEPLFAEQPSVKDEGGDKMGDEDRGGEENRVYACGAFRNTGNFGLQGNESNLGTLFARAGGGTLLADTRSVLLTRADGTEETISLDDGWEGVKLRDGDSVQLFELKIDPER